MNARDPNQPTGSPSGWQKFVMIVKVIEVRLRFIVILVAVGFVIGYWDVIKNHWDKWTRPAAEVGAVGSDTEFFCPMHPSVVRPTLDPGGQIPKCPICGMPLSKRKKGEAPKLPNGVLSRVQLSPDRVRLAGVQTVEVAYQPLMKEINTVGVVDYDESRLARIVTRVDGYLEKLAVDRTWITVNKGDPLAEIYSAELYSSAKDLLGAMDSKDTQSARSIRERLRLLGVSDAEIDVIVQSHTAIPLIVIRAPQGGHVIRKEVRQGDHVEPGKILFEVADLSVVWVEADVYEKDIQFLQVGQTVEARVESLPNRVFTGKVSVVHPHVDTTTRTNAVRLELENPKHELRPGMFASVRIQTPLRDIEPFKSLLAEGPLATTAIRSDEPRDVFACPGHAGVMMDQPGNCPKCSQELARRPLNENERLIWWCPTHPKVSAEKPGDECEDCSGMKLVPKLLLSAKPGEVLAVPERAVVDTGSKKIVYVEREPGTFYGLPVEVGPRTGGFYPVVNGLEPGDRVAAAGAFLIDAETRLNPAAGSTYLGASGGPASGKSAATTSSQSSTQASRQSTPAKKLSAGELKQVDRLSAADRTEALAQLVCPISDEPLGSMGVPFKMTVKGQPILLCCQGCEAEVKKNPDDALKKVAELKSSRKTDRVKK